MKAVYKYVATENGAYAVPQATTPVLFEMQLDNVYPHLWVELQEHQTDPGYPIEIFQIYGTGYVVPPTSEHVASCIDRKRNMVWHLYKEMA